MTHQQLWCPEIGDKVDEDLAPILRQLWAAGVQTIYSCKGGWDTEDIAVTMGREYPGYLMYKREHAHLIDWSLFGSPRSDSYVRMFRDDAFCMEQYGCLVDVVRFDPIGANAQHATCCVLGCEKPYKARDFCNTHYSRWRRTGDPLVGLT